MSAAPIFSLFRRLFLLTIVLASLSFPQDSTRCPDPFVQTDEWNARKIISTGIVGGVLAGSLVSSYYDWWKDSAEPFHFVSEGSFNDYSLGIDKVGHAYTSYFYFHTFRNTMLWGGYSPSAAFWWAAGTSAFFAVSIEIGDGFSPYGFSFEDLAFNMAGLGYGMLQVEIPFLQNIDFKWSYVPSEGYTWPPHFTDHYDAHLYWLTFDMHNLLPSGVGKNWPAWLQLGLAYGVGEQQTVREFVVGLDYNLEVICTDNRELSWLLRQLNLFHFPAPGVKFSPGRPPEWRVFLLN